MTRRPALAGAAVLAVAIVAAGGWWLWPRPAPPALSAPQAGAEIPVPSGQRVLPLDRSIDEDGTVRFRFLAPEIEAGTAGEQAADDMQALCDGYALAHLPDPAAPPAQIIISLSASEVPLGEIRADVTQFFEGYRVADGTCVWEIF